MTTHRCDACLGEGRCWICSGDGCARCTHTGRCHLCQAEPRVIRLVAPPEAESATCDDERSRD